ncbi:MAG: catalase-related domain-containing protein [Longicatena sp.]
MYQYDYKDDPTDDNFKAGGDLYRIMSEEQKAILIDNTARNIAPVTNNIKYRHAVHCYLADSDYGTRMTSALGLDLNTVMKLSTLPNNELNLATLKEM